MLVFRYANACVYSIGRSKEVAEGGVSFYLERFVTHRVTKHTYGVESSTPFLPFLPSHIIRMDEVRMDIEGPRLDGRFAAILKKV